MHKQSKDQLVQAGIFKCTGIMLSLADARTIRLAAKKIQDWAVADCNGDVEWNEETEKWHHVYWTNNRRDRVVAKEPVQFRYTDGRAKSSIRNICIDNNLHYYIQGDPRGLMVYIGKEPMTYKTYHYNYAVPVIF